MGTARHEINTVSVGFSRADERAPDTARAAVLYGADVPISGQAASREGAPYKEKRTLPGAPADVPHFVCVTARGRWGHSPCPDLHPRRLHPGSLPRLPRSPRRPSYSSLLGFGITRDGPVWVRRSSAIHFQGWLIRQNRYGLPPEFPLASFYSSIVHHLSGPSMRAPAPPHRRRGRDGPVVRPSPRWEKGSHLGKPETALAFTAPLGFVPLNDSRAC
ncbi:hypothetical protein EGW08_023846 [Elysia chlorotica]|uniref:Uncharacterized protein n=1 Tax=Elysia chlorotica TaxID=188477 RepID=A0A433SHZ7_ELYCH|nr:hypothetical protein EGW08_023846 [Elysia chlorotica]